MHDLIKPFRLQLKKIKTIDRNLEMTLDLHVNEFHMSQFLRDVQVYGLYEALLYAKNEDLARAILIDLKLIPA